MIHDECTLLYAASGLNSAISSALFRAQLLRWHLTSCATNNSSRRENYHTPCSADTTLSISAIWSYCCKKPSPASASFRRGGLHEINPPVLREWTNVAGQGIAICCRRPRAGKQLCDVATDCLHRRRLWQTASLLCGTTNLCEKGCLVVEDFHSKHHNQILSML